MIGNFGMKELRDRTFRMSEGGVEGWGGWRVFVGVMKYFRHILMGHKIFFKIFDGSQNISLCSIFVILFSKVRGRSTKYPY